MRFIMIFIATSANWAPPSSGVSWIPGSKVGFRAHKVPSFPDSHAPKINRLPLSQSRSLNKLFRLQGLRFLCSQDLRV